MNQNQSQQLKAEPQCLENTGFSQEHDFSCVISMGRQLLIFCIVEHSSVLDSRYCLSGCQGDVSAGAAAGTQSVPVLRVRTACAQGVPTASLWDTPLPGYPAAFLSSSPRALDHPAAGQGSLCRGLPAVLPWSCTKQLLSPSQAGRAVPAVME